MSRNKQSAKRKLSLCFPVYQNAGSLQELYRRSREAMEISFPEIELEFIFVNDGSTDGSLEELRAIKEESHDQRIKIINFSRNFGAQAACIAAWTHASGDACIVLAADLQDPPEQCIEMVKEWERGNDIVISYRRSHGTSLLKRFTSRVAYRILLPQSPYGGFDFVLFDRKALNALLSLTERNRFFQHDVLSLGFPLKFIPYDKLERRVGKSQFGHLKRWNYFLTGYLNATYMPIRFFSFVGLLFALASATYTGMIVYAYFAKKTPFEGWAPIMVLLLLIGGLIMIMLGLIGEYVWRIFDEVKKRPQYFIKDIY
jgi:glycosyltransferase involved in cell wall biosynthesis